MKQLLCRALQPLNRMAQSGLYLPHAGKDWGPPFFMMQVRCLEKGKGNLEFTVAVQPAWSTGWLPLPNCPSDFKGIPGVWGLPAILGERLCQSGLLMSESVLALSGAAKASV